MNVCVCVLYAIGKSERHQIQILPCFRTAISFSKRTCSEANATFFSAFSINDWCSQRTEWRGEYQFRGYVLSPPLHLCILYMNKCDKRYRKKQSICYLNSIRHIKAKPNDQSANKFSLTKTTASGRSNGWKHLQMIENFVRN